MIWINPYTLFFWIVGSWIIALLGKNKRFGFLGMFLISVVFSPLVGVIVLMASDDKLPRRMRH